MAKHLDNNEEDADGDALAVDWNNVRFKLVYLLARAHTVMPSIHFNYGSWWNWETAAAGGYPNQKVVFDGPNKIIFVNEGVTELDVQSDFIFCLEGMED